MESGRENSLLESAISASGHDSLCTRECRLAQRIQSGNLKIEAGHGSYEIATDRKVRTVYSFDMLPGTSFLQFNKLIRFA